MKLANLLFQQQNYVEASGHYNYLSHIDTTNWFVLRQLAICYEELHTPPTFPITYYLKALELNPLDQVSVSRLSRIYFSMNDYKKALDLTNGFLEIDSLNTRVLRLNGYTYLHLREADSAIKQFHKCITLADTSFFVYKFLGLSYFQKNDYEPTIDYLTKAYRIDSTDIQTSFFLGASCGRLYYKQKGIDYLHHTLTLLKPDKDMVSKVYKELALAYQSFSKYNEANLALEQALEVNPTDNEILLQMGKNFDHNLKDYDNAIKYYSMYIDSTSANNDTLGTVYYNRIRSEKRIEKIKEENFWKGEGN
jgi:tetratricopeptide (TPR) repeat protein